MCDNCFTTEIKKFENRTQWTTFDLELTQKLGQGKLKEIRVVNKRRQGDEYELHVYQCATCGQKWKLQDQDNHPEGYFIKLTTFDNLVTRQLKDRQIALLVLLVVVIFIEIRVISG
jgi:hypothetical protein